MNINRLLDNASPDTAPVWKKWKQTDNGDGTVTPAVALAAGTASIGVVSATGSGVNAQPTVTRPANTTAYAAGDVVGGAITFAAMGDAGGVTLIQCADLRIDVTAIPSGMTTFRLHLYNVTPPSAIADNAAWDLPSGDRASYLGYIDLGTVADLGSTLFVQTETPPGKVVKLAALETAVYGYLQTIAGYTPAANSEVYAPRLTGVKL